jgi:hypothetical protein
LHFEAEGEDDDFARVVRVRDRLARAQAQAFFPFAEGFVVGVYVLMLVCMEIEFGLQTVVLVMIE